MAADLQRLMAALAALPAAPAEAEFREAMVCAACCHLGFRRAWLWLPGPGEGWRVGAGWPEPGAGPPPPADPESPGPGLHAFATPQGLIFQVEGEADPDLAAAFAAAAGHILSEIGLRERLVQRAQRLSRRAREVEQRHRDLTLRLAELHGELDTSQQRQVILSERNRISQDLHDRAAQTNFLVVLKLDWLLTGLPPDSPLRPEMERLKELAAQAAAQTREAIHALRAPELSEGGLAGGIRSLLRSLAADGLETNLTVVGVPAPLPAEVEEGLFKLAQEALSNARKHSRGSVVMVTLRYAPSLVTLVVLDNGVGLPPGAGEPEPGRYGLRGMRERVAALGGELALVSGDEGGLIVRATIPIAKG